VRILSSCARQTRRRGHTPRLRHRIHPDIAEQDQPQSSSVCRGTLVPAEKPFHRGRRYLALAVKQRAEHPDARAVKGALIQLASPIQIDDDSKFLGKK
jgi:hypothetical protein